MTGYRRPSYPARRSRNSTSPWPWVWTARCNAAPTRSRLGRHGTGTESVDGYGRSWDRRSPRWITLSVERCFDRELIVVHELLCLLFAPFLPKDVTLEQITQVPAIELNAE